MYENGRVPNYDLKEENKKNPSGTSFAAKKPASATKKKSSTGAAKTGQRTKTETEAELKYSNYAPVRQARREEYEEPERKTVAAQTKGRGSSAKRRKKKRRQKLIASMTAIVLFGVLLGACILLIKSCTVEQGGTTDPGEEPPKKTEKLGQGITVNGIDVSAKTREEAIELITPGLEYTAANIAVTLQGDNFAYRITGEEMGVVSNLDAILDAAIAGEDNSYYYTGWDFDYQLMSNRISEINESFETGPTDASFSVDIAESGKPVFTYTEGKQGYGLDVESTEAMVREALEKGELQPVLTPALTMVDPQVTIADIKAHTSLRASFTTTYRSDRYDGLSDEQAEIIQNRAFNIGKGAELLNGLKVKPGETVSFNKVVGDRTEERGWKLANAIIFGNQYTLEAGGGICQVSTTLYGALLRSDIEIVSRRHHSFPSDYVPKGLDATVDTDHIDFKFKNDTQYPLYVFCYITKNKSSNRKRDITVAIYGEALPEGVTYEPRTELVEEILPGETKIIYDKKKTEDYSAVEVEGRNGYIINVFLDKFVNKKLESSELLYTDEYNAVQEQIRVGTLPLETPTPVPTATPKPTPGPEGGDE